jgi:hypothetical protein|tara:strand:+ start:1536 stop:1727 length:192 start_codon:yes stop_codon:yes gene_type:complete
MTLFYKPQEAANILSISTRTLANKRALGNGPPYLKLNGVIRYPIDAFETYLNKHLHHNARYVK